MRMKLAIQKIKQIVSSLIKKVAWNQRLPKHQISVSLATILTFEFYGLGVHSLESDIDVLYILNPLFMRNIDDRSRKSLSIVCANKRILQLAPNLEQFQAMLQFLKFWNKNGGGDLAVTNGREKLKHFTSSESSYESDD
ncbi:nuclear poly(A) polymerase 3-like [Senna tora]|uniref:Nuclear poly(A) polymerase 3-like n=1 Tax=Senna tora TaxID=362788 RepID=A0A834THZ8_9FABA|nr:nuclear poly(A) polymerase 3-like [Senna tora]